MKKFYSEIELEVLLISEEIVRTSQWNDNSYGDDKDSPADNWDWGDNQ